MPVKQYPEKPPHRKPVSPSESNPPLLAASQYRQKNPLNAWEPTPEQLANATAGLSPIHIEDIFLRAEQEGRLTWDLVRERKQAMVASEFGEVLEILEPRFGFENIGGLEHVKRFFQDSVIEKPTHPLALKRKGLRRA